MNLQIGEKNGPPQQYSLKGLRKMQWNCVNGLLGPRGSVWEFSAIPSVTLMKAPYPKPFCSQRLLPINCYSHPRANFIMFSFFLFSCLFGFYPGKLPWADLILISYWYNFLSSSNVTHDGCGVRPCQTSSYMGWVKLQVLGTWEI